MTGSPTRTGRRSATSFVRWSSASRSLLIGFGSSSGLTRATLTSMNNLALVYREQGRYGEAEQLCKEALEGRRAALGPTHPATLASLHNLALVYREQGRYGEAEQLDKETLEGRRAALGPTHPATLTSMNNLALA